MKKLTAFLLTLTLLIGMVGTVSLAADDVKGTTFPKESVIIDAAGNVAITFAGVENFDAGSAVITVTKKDGTTKDVDVNLAYDSVKKVFTGQNADAAGGVIKSFSLDKYETKTATDGSSNTINNNANFTYFSTGDLKGKLNTASISKQTTAKGKTGLVTKTTRDYQSVRYDDVNGRINYDYAVVSETTYGDKGQETGYTYTRTNKNYKTGTGVYSGKTVSTYKETYDKDGVYQGYTESLKTYNLDNKVVGTRETKSTTSLNAKKDIKTVQYDSVAKVLSTKNLTKQTTKESMTVAYTLVNNIFEPASLKYDKTVKDRDGKTKQVVSDVENYYNGDLLIATETQQDFNTYTGKMTHERVDVAKNEVDAKTKELKETITSTETWNNDDGSLRSKVYTGWTTGEDEATEIHYNKDNKVVATYDKDGTWKDGIGNVIGTNAVDKDGNWTSTSVSFRERTGEIAGYELEAETTKDDIVTHTDVTFEGGNKTSDFKQVYNKKDGSYAIFNNGVMSEYYTENDGNYEYKYYDMKGTLKETQKYDKTKNTWTTYDYRGRVKQIIEYSEDGTKRVAKYDTATEKLKELTISKDNVTGYYNGLGMLVYTKEIDEKTGDIIYRDPSFGEFAREYTKGNQYAKEETQTLIKEPSVKDGINVTVEKEVTNRDYQAKETTTTKDFTKWSVTNGIKGADLTRKEVIKQTYSEDVDKTTVTKDGILTKDTTKNKNVYDDVTKKTVTYYDWYTGALSGKTKYFQSGKDNDPMSYDKVYDKHDNLQTYSATDDTDDWNWNKTYYASSQLKSESWYDGLDGLSSYSAGYYLDGTPWYRHTNTQDVAYNSDGTWFTWSDKANGVTNSWLYDVNGNLTGYQWNQKNVNGVETYDYYDAASNLIYSYIEEPDVLGEVQVTRYDPAGNRWVKWDDQVTLTLANGGSGWQNAVGVWFYVENGKPVQSQWKKIDGEWYYFDADGFMETGIKGDAKEKKTYALDGDTGALITGGWAYVGDERHDAWAFTDANGEVVTGWKQIGGKWYYFEDGWDNGHDKEYKGEAKWTQSLDRGTMVTGAASIWTSDWNGKHTYFFNDDGTWDNSPGWKVAQWAEVGSIGGEDAWDETSDSSRETMYGVEWHYYDKNGNEVTGWQQIDGEWYYFNADGVMKNGWIKSGDKWYFMDPTDGALATNGWVEDVYEGWYYMDKNGQYQTGWLKDGNQWYYLKSDGAMAENEWAKSGNNWYYMDKNGQIATGWIQDKGSWYYLNKDGAMKTGWEGSGNTWYYLGEDGAMVTNTDKTIDGKVYHFDENGLCTNPY